MSSSPEASEERDGSYQSFKLSWVCYLGVLFWFLVRLLLFGAIAVACERWLGVKWVGYALFAFNILWSLYRVVYLQSLVLYTNVDGVWMFQGLLPWSKGVSGVKWRDISEATFSQGFSSWAFGAYSIRIGHRFTNSAELRINNLRRGDLAVEHVNRVLATTLSTFR